MSLVDPEAARYAEAHTSPPAGEVADIRAETEATMPLPQMAGGLVETRLLEALAVTSRARRVLEIGTFTGVSALSIAARLPEDGTVVTLEADPDVAAIARRNVEASPHGRKVRLVEGDARETIATLDGPFDLIFLDAWKSDYPAYYDAVLPLLAPHGVLVADNVLRRGTVLPGRDDASAEAAALRAFADRVQADSRVDNLLLTVGDGLLLVWPHDAR